MAVGWTTYGCIVALIHYLFSTVHLKELCTIPQRSLKIVTSITLTTKWISRRKIAATEMLFLPPSPTPLGLSCTDSNFALATANVETRMTGSSLPQSCWQQGQTAVFPGCGCSCPQFRWKQKHIQPLWKFSYLCLCVLKKNTVHEAHGGPPGAGAQPS